MTEDKDFLHDLRRTIELEIRSYVYPRSEASVGVPWGEDRVAAGLENMKNALIEPYWSEVEVWETVGQIERAVASKRRCVVVADDQSETVLVWDSIEDEFLLAMKVEGSLHSIGVRGDAVGCFLAI